jgi:hypothetical protein
METAGFSKKKSTKKEFTLVFEAQTVIIPDVFRNYTVIKGFTFDEFALLVFDIEPVKHNRKGFVQNKNSNDQHYDNDEFHKVRFSF